MYNSPACPASYLEADLGTAVRDAVAAGKRTITFEINGPDTPVSCIRA